MVVLVAARNEADRVGATLAALAAALPGAPVFVADDASSDSTPRIAAGAGARVIGSSRRAGKGGAMTRAARAALTGLSPDAVVLLCDGDLGASAGELTRLVEAVRDGRAALAVAAFSAPAGGGFGIALGFARWALRSTTAGEMRAPISGQRAMRASLLAALLPFAAGYGMELAMSIDALRSGAGVLEIELELEHRSSGRTPAGFAHRGRQLLSFMRVYAGRR